MTSLSSRDIFTIQVLIVLYFSLLAAGSDAHTPLSDNKLVGWQTGSKSRGTWAIASNCFSTIFACTWSIQHLNVPGKSTVDGEWARKLRSCKWMVVNILFPEFMVLQATLEFYMAIQALNLMRKNGKEVAYPWWYNFLFQQSSNSWRHPIIFSYFHRHPTQDPEPKPVERPKWTLTHCFFANMGGFYYNDGESRFPLTALQIAAEESGFNTPNMQEQDIQDKSKSDWFAKIIAVLQFSQLILSLIVRRLQGLDFSQLETITLGFVLCGALIYLIYLYKPQNVVTPFDVPSQGIDGSHLQCQRTYDSF